MTRLSLHRATHGVSPVVGTILMVAITVVLAAVLYIMATGMIGGGGATIPPTVELLPSIVGPQTWRVEVQTDRSEILSHFRVSMVNESTGTFCVAEADLTATFNATCDGGTALAFDDAASPASQALNSGDAFQVTGIAPGNLYTLRLVWKASGGVIKGVTVPAG